MINWNQIQNICYHLQIRNHRKMVDLRLPLPSKYPFFSSDNFRLHKAKNIIQCFALSVCVCLCVLHICIVMQQKVVSAIYKLKYCKMLVKFALILRVSESQYCAYALNVCNRNPKFCQNTLHSVLNRIEVWNIYYNHNHGNHNNTTDSKLPLPPK